MRCARCGSHNPFNRLLGGAIRPVLGGVRGAVITTLLIGYWLALI